MTEEQTLYCWDRLVRALERRATVTDRQREDLVTWIYDQGPDPELAAAADKLLNGHLTADEAARGYESHRIEGFDLEAYRERLAKVQDLPVSVADGFIIDDALGGQMPEALAESAGSTARKTLRKAHFFCEQAEHARLVDREAFGANFETAIVWGRSVTIHLQKVYDQYPEFQAWYSGTQEKMKADRLLRFFVEARNFVLKQGPVGVRKVISISLDAFSRGAAELQVQVPRGKPWYQRSPRIIWEDVTAAAMRPIRRWRERRRELARQRAQSAQQSTTKASSEDFYFDDPQWSHRPALELLREYLHKLELVVAEAEKKFGGGP